MLPAVAASPTVSSKGSDSEGQSLGNEIVRCSIRRTQKEAVMARVGTEKVFDSDKVIVWNFVPQAGEETPVHTHERAYMWYAINGAPSQIFDETGTT